MCEPSVYCRCSDLHCADCCYVRLNPITSAKHSLALKDAPKKNGTKNVSGIGLDHKKNRSAVRADRENCFRDRIVALRGSPEKRREVWTESRLLLNQDRTILLEKMTIVRKFWRPQKVHAAERIHQGRWTVNMFRANNLPSQFVCPVYYICGVADHLIRVRGDPWADTQAAVLTKAPKTLCHSVNMRIHSVQQDHNDLFWKNFPCASCFLSKWENTNLHCTQISAEKLSQVSCATMEQIQWWVAEFPTRSEK